MNGTAPQIHKYTYEFSIRNFNYFDVRDHSNFFNIYSSDLSSSACFGTLDLKWPLDEQASL